MIKITREFITPEIAEAMLKKNTRNVRGISPEKLRQYVNDLKSGRWEDNGETIKFYADGTLFDGQHRLAAIVKSGISVWLHVARGIDEDVLITDVGYIRQVHQLAGVRVCDAGLTSALMLPNGKGKSDVTKADQVVFTKDHADLLKFITNIGGQSKSGGKRGCKFFNPTDNSAACLAILFAIRKKVATVRTLEMFCKCTNEGLPLDGIESSAPLMLRKMFIEGVASAEGFMRRWSLANSVDFVAYSLLTLQAIKAFSEGKKVTKRFTVGRLDFEELRKDALENIEQVEQDLGITGQVAMQAVINA